MSCKTQKRGITCAHNCFKNSHPHVIAVLQRKKSKASICIVAATVVFESTAGEYAVCAGLGFVPDFQANSSSKHGFGTARIKLR